MRVHIRVGRNAKVDPSLLWLLYVYNTSIVVSESVDKTSIEVHYGMVDSS